MTPIAGAAFLPHPPILVPEIGNGEERSAAITQEGFWKVIEEIKQCNPDVLIVLTPHGRDSQHILAVNTADAYEGSFVSFGYPQLVLKAQPESELLINLLAFAKEKGLSITDNNIKLDHGALVPLYFMQKEGIKLPLVHISVGWSDLKVAYETGKKLASVCESYGKRIMILASGDLSHRLKENGPYGFHPKGPVFDKRIKAAFGDNNLKSLLDMDKRLIEEAGQCGLIPFLIAAGMLDSFQVRTECHSYENPYGVGYLCGFAKIERNTQHHAAVLLAKTVIEQYVEEKTLLDLETFVEDHPDDPFIKKASTLKAGAFVSIHTHGSLRGCIGTIESAYDNLLEEIVANAIEASTRDPRFEPIEADELDDLEIKVDVMGPLEKVVGTDELDVQKYGVVVESGYRRGLLLPALEGVETVEQQLSIACRKAGIGLSEKYQMFRFKVTRYQ